MGLTRTIMREPLVHFLAGGLALFLLYAVIGGDDAEEDARRIVIDQSTVDYLAERHEATWSRPPTEQELSRLVEAYVREEVLYREGVAMGLDRHDPVVKRRVRQKLDVLSEEFLRSETDPAELAGWYEANSERYTAPAVVTFEQVLLDPAEGEELEDAAAAVRAQLAAGTPVAEAGAPTMLPSRLRQAPLDLVARDFGQAFAESLETVPQGEWAGPVFSGLGAHLVRIESRMPSRQPALDEVRTAVARDYEAEQRRAASERFYDGLQEDYEIIYEVEIPQPGAMSAIDDGRRS